MFRLLHISGAMFVAVMWNKLGSTLPVSMWRFFGYRRRLMVLRWGTGKCVRILITVIGG